MPLNYVEISEKYRPTKINTLLIGEAPPPCGTKYFYLPQKLKNNLAIRQDRSLPATVFWHYFNQRPQDEKEYIVLLNSLKDAGIFLVDIMDEPIRIRGNKENEERLVNELPFLRSKLEMRGINVPEEDMIFLLARNTYKQYIKKHFKYAQLIPWIEYRLNAEETITKKYGLVDEFNRCGYDKQAYNLVDYIKKLTDFTVVSNMDDNYNHMGATITDAVLQAGITYETVVKPRVKHLMNKYPSAKTTHEFWLLLQEISPVSLLNFNGIKGQRILEVTKFFDEHNIQTEENLHWWLSNNQNAEKLLSIKGIGDKTVDYFKILVGIKTSAIDRHLYGFLGKAGIKSSDYSTAQKIVNDAADILKVDKALFDHSIWKYMSQRQASKMKSKCF